MGLMEQLNRERTHVTGCVFAEQKLLSGHTHAKRLGKSKYSSVGCNEWSQIYASSTHPTTARLYFSNTENLLPLPEGKLDKSKSWYLVYSGTTLVWRAVSLRKEWNSAVSVSFPVKTLEHAFAMFELGRNTVLISVRCFSMHCGNTSAFLMQSLFSHVRCCRGERMQVRERERYITATDIRGFQHQSKVLLGRSGGDKTLKAFCSLE